jgi:hypothetical protein
VCGGSLMARYRASVVVVQGGGALRRARRLRFQGSLEFGESAGGVFEQAGILLPVRHLPGAELADNQSVVDFDQEN